MKQLHPGAKWIFRVQAYIVMIFLSFFIGVFLFPMAEIIYIIMAGAEQFSYSIAAGWLIAYIVFVITAAEVHARLAYDKWFYELTETGIKLERGIIWKKYSDIPYERIQNVDIDRGVFAQIFGFSTIMVQTAGYSNYQYAEGHIPALDEKEAQKVRDFLLKKITKKK